MHISSRVAGSHRAFLLAFLSLGSTAHAASADDIECLVQPYVEVKLSSAVPGILDQVAVERGDAVTKGQVLAMLKSDVERATVDLARAKVAFAARKVERSKELQRKQMISISEKDEMETEMEILKLELRAAEEHLKLRTIVSPIDGVVTRRHFSPGEYVEQEPILSLAQIDPLRVEAVVPVRMHGQVRVGMKARVTWEPPIRAVQTADVKVVDPVVDAASGTIGVRLDVPNPRHILPAGTRCTVSFPAQSTGGPPVSRK